jgi:hypothetical protein
MAERVVVTGDLERLKLLGFSQPPAMAIPDDLDDDAPVGQPLLSKLGMENAPLEEKARVITEAWLTSLTENDIRKMGAAGVDKVAKIAGLGGAKRPDPNSNPIIMAIIIALQNLGVKPPPLQVIEGETMEGK